MSKKIGFKTNLDEDIVRELKILATIGEIDVNDILEPLIEYYLYPNPNLREIILFKLLTKKARNNTLPLTICKMVLRVEEGELNSILKELQNKGCIVLEEDGKHISITDAGKDQSLWK